MMKVSIGIFVLLFFHILVADGYNCQKQHRLMLLRVQKTGSTSLLRWLQAYEISQSKSSLFQNMGGCTPAKLTGSDIMADIPDMVCPTVGGAALEDFISCDANARILKSSHSHNQYWQFPNPKMIAKKFIGSSAASYEASDGQFYGETSTRSIYIHDAVTIREPADWFYSMWQYKDGLEARAEEAGNARWSTFYNANNRSITTVDFEGYIEGSYYMWNTFARSLVGDFRGSSINIVNVKRAPTREEALEELKGIDLDHSALTTKGIGRNKILREAIKRLNSFTFFSIYDRYVDSLELFEFTFCVKASRDSPFQFVKDQLSAAAERKKGMHRTTRKEAIEKAGGVIADRLRLDITLYKMANVIFDNRMRRMSALKAKGYACSLYGSECAVKC